MFKVTNLRNLFYQAAKVGFFQVFSANLVSYLVAFCGSVVFARMMGKHEFGVYAFSYNIISFFLLVNGFGAASGVLQFVSRSTKDIERLSYLKYSLNLGMAFNLILSIAIFIYAMLASLPIPEARHILLAMSFFPLGRLYIDVFQSFLRATHQNFLLSKFAIFSSLILFISNIIGIYCYGLIGFIISTYISYLLVIIVSIVIFKFPNILLIKRQSINTKEFITYSIYVTVGNAFSQILFILDILVLGYIVKDASLVAAYKVATIIPFALNFIPGVISTFFYPYFAKNANNLEYVRSLKRKLQLGMLGFSLPVSLILIIIAKPLIMLIFGHEYLNSVLPFQILTFGFWIIATFRTINGNILASLGKAKFAMWFNIIIVLINLVLTYILVLHFGIIGAAIGVIIIYIIAGVAASLVLHQILTK